MDAPEIQTVKQENSPSRVLTIQEQLALIQETVESRNRDENKEDSEKDASESDSDQSHITGDTDISVQEIDAEAEPASNKEPKSADVPRLRRSKRNNFGNRYQEAMKTDKEDDRTAAKRNLLLESDNTFNADDSSSEEDDADFRPENHPKKAKSPDGEDGSDSKSGSDSSDNEDSKDGSNQSADNHAVANASSSHPNKIPRKKDPLYSAFDQKKSLDDLLTEVAMSTRLDGFKICSICLWDECDPEADAVIQCDSCGCTVHEACYGVAGNELEELHAKDADAQSSSETMPWFCDPCRFGRRDPQCVMCPNRFGAFKQTVKGEWVHNACARYTKEVYFDDDVKLTDVVLADIPHNRWGDHPCIVCDDIYGKHAGITIKCETGMCRKYLHVTCAMLVGSAVEMEPEMGYPLAIYCADHTPKDDRAGNRRCFLAALGLQRRHQIEMQKIDPMEHERLQAAEEVQRVAYLEHRQSRKLESGLGISVRPLYAAHSLISKGHARSEALGFGPKPVVNPSPSFETAKLSRPDFRPEFVAYVYRRETMIADYIDRMEKAKTDRDDATDGDWSQDKILWKTIVPHLRAEKDILSKLLAPFTKYSDHMKNAALTNGKRRPKIDELLRKAEKSEEEKKPVEVQCDTCGNDGFPPRMARCDECQKYFHLKCLDPPMSSVPNRRGVKWLCSACVSTEEDSDEVESETDVAEGRPRRRLQGQNPARAKQNAEPVPAPVLPAGPRKRGRKPGFRPQKKPKVVNGETASGMSEVKPRASRARRRRSSEEASTGICVVCNQPGDNKNAVDCATCRDWYHFATCLEPPCAKSPRSRFYGWLCEKCTEAQDNFDPMKVESDEE